MHFGDSIFIFLLALVLFGPKKLPEIGRQVGKLLAEFRRASNEFKFQIQEEIRNMEDEERRKKLAESRAAAEAAAGAATPAATEGAVSEGSAAVAETPTSDIPPPPEIVPTILPPSMGEPVSTGRPFAPPAEEAAASEPQIRSPKLAMQESGVSADLPPASAYEDAAEIAERPASTNGNHALPEGNRDVADDVREQEIVRRD